MSGRNSVFINCPFDKAYQKLFRAIVFTVYDCGFDPYCALNTDDSGHVRVEKIYRMISSCRLGIHDISRTERDPKTKLPRFNMPFELGVFLGAKKFGSGKQRKKATLILDKAPYRYQKFISDIAGQDIHSHRNQPDEAIRTVRNWLRQVKHEKGRPPLLSGKEIISRYRAFCSELKPMCAVAKLDKDALTYRDYMWLVKRWVQRTLDDRSQ